MTFQIDLDEPIQELDDLETEIDRLAKQYAKRAKDQEAELIAQLHRNLWAFVALCLKRACLPMTW